MTQRERILTVLRGGIPDHVPCCPDISNMIPCRLTGKPFTDIYLYKNPPLWRAQIDALIYFDIGGGWEVYDDAISSVYGPATGATEERIVHRRKDGRIATQRYDPRTGEWADVITVYSTDTPPLAHIEPEKLGLPMVPSEWEPLTGVKEWPKGWDLWLLIRRELGEQGVMSFDVGAWTKVLRSEQDIYSYYDDPEPWRRKSRELLEAMERNMEIVAHLDPKPDVLSGGGSGTLIYQTPEIFVDLGLPILKRFTEMAYDLGIPTHVHSCGPERELVALAAEHTKLTCIDPLEPPPMGDCDLADLKRRFGATLVLKGNLHTTDVMLLGSVEDVRAASRKAIDDAARGGRFILSTGDQCGRDTPDENIFAMAETARTYGRY